MLNKRQIVCALMLSPYYFSLSLAERRSTVRDLETKFGFTSPGPSSLEPKPLPISLPLVERLRTQLA